MEKKRFRPNIHMVLAAVVIICIAVIFFKFKNWGVSVNHDDIFNDGTGDYVDNYDSNFPLQDEEGDIIPLKTEDGLNIVLFGNHPFSDDRDSKDGLANLIAAMAKDKMKGSGNVTVYNCSIGGSYVAAEQPQFTAERPWDAFSPYWMSLMTTDIRTNDYYGAAMDALGEDVPDELREVRRTLSEIDFSTVDVIALMYDGTDYLMGHPINEDSEDLAAVQQFSPHLDATLDILLENHPNVRIIVLSPTYAFSDQLDENGDYISSDIHVYGKSRQTLSRYVVAEYHLCGEKGVTFIDNAYGTFNEDEAKDYLTDNLHLNVEGRKKVAERFVSALFYYGTDK